MEAFVEVRRKLFRTFIPALNFAFELDNTRDV